MNHIDFSFWDRNYIKINSNINSELNKIKTMGTKNKFLQNKFLPQEIKCYLSQNQLFEQYYLLSTSFYRH